MRILDILSLHERYAEASGVLRADGGEPLSILRTLSVPRHDPLGPEPHVGSLAEKAYEDIACAVGIVAHLPGDRVQIADAESRPPGQVAHLRPDERINCTRRALALVITRASLLCEVSRRRSIEYTARTSNGASSEDDALSELVAQSAVLSDVVPRRPRSSPIDEVDIFIPRDLSSVSKVSSSKKKIGTLHLRGLVRRVCRGHRCVKLRDVEMKLRCSGADRGVAEERADEAGRARSLHVDPAQGAGQGAGGGRETGPHVRT